MVCLCGLRESLAIQLNQESRMHAPSYFRSDTAIALAPWIIATAACIVSFVLLTQFIDTLHSQMQRGQALRARPSAPAIAQIDVPEPITDDGQKVARVQP